MITDLRTLCSLFLIGFLANAMVGCSGKSGDSVATNTGANSINELASTNQVENAEQLLRRAEQGDPDAENTLGVMYQTGNGVPKDSAAAADWYRLSAEQGNAYAQRNLGWLYKNGEGVARNNRKAAELYEQAIKNGYFDAQIELAELYRSVKIIDKNGEHPWNLERAAELYRSVAETGNSDAQNILGVMYQNGEGVPESYPDAVKWYRKAAEAGNTSAQYNLGAMYENGAGVPHDYRSAFDWTQKAAENGSAGAQVKLSDFYEKGRGTPKDYSKAFIWMLSAARQGDGGAQFKVGEMFENGQGVIKDLVLAYAWKNIAQSSDLPTYEDCENKSGFMCPVSLLYLERLLRPPELAEAQRLSTKWKKGEPLVRSDENESRGTDLSQLKKQTTGTAFFVSTSGYAVTNNHIIDGCKNVTTEGKAKSFEVVATDSINDLALLRSSDVRADIAELLRESVKPMQGQEIVVFGFPLNTVLSSGGNLTPGVISALTGVGDNSSQIQITAPIQPGSSGSPVMDKHGDVIAIVAKKLSDSVMAEKLGTLGQNVNFAVSGQTLVSFLDAHQVQYKRDTSWFAMDKSLVELADQARKWTVVVECWR